MDVLYAVIVQKFNQIKKKKKETAISAFYKINFQMYYSYIVNVAINRLYKYEKWTNLKSYKWNITYLRAYNRDWFSIK